MLSIIFTINSLRENDIGLKYGVGNGERRACRKESLAGALAPVFLYFKCSFKVFRQKEELFHLVPNIYTYVYNNSQGSTHFWEHKHMKIPSGVDIWHIYILRNLKWSLLKYFSLQSLQYNLYHIAFIMFRLCVTVVLNSQLALKLAQPSENG